VLSEVQEQIYLILEDAKLGEEIVRGENGCSIICNMLQAAQKYVGEKFIL
jgi:hypothetical protein